jgi:molybdate transport repressor ModE-like protein
MQYPCAPEYAEWCVKEESMRLTPSLCWVAGPDRKTPVDPKAFALLAGISDRGSLRAAASAIGLPYRTAWGLLQDLERALGSPLVQLQRGRGATLTPDGAALLRADESARQRFARDFDALGVDVGPPDGWGRSGSPPVLRCAASHDPALVALQDALPAAAGVRLQVEFCGSLEALARFRNGEVELAGFHYVPEHAEALRRLLRHLRPSRDRLLRFVDREQGLIVSRGNRRHVKCLADVVRRRLRFVNRQPGSGTRMLLDARLVLEGLAAGDLVGYESEEFTHAAVAATIASGRAEAGFGVAAAAAEYDLGFVPLEREHYCFAVRESMLRSAPIVALRQSLAGPIFRELVGQMTGYDAKQSGDLEGVEVGRRRRVATTSLHRSGGRARTSRTSAKPTG